MESLIRKMKDVQEPLVGETKANAKIVPKESDLEKALVAGIDEVIARDIQTKYRKQTGFSPSATNLCPRYHVYLFRGIDLPATHNSRVQRIFDNGNSTHERIYSYLEKMGILLEKEFRVEHPDPPINSYIDGIIDWDGHKVLEIKSISEAGFTYRRLFHKPKDDHYHQIQLYMHITGLDEGFVLYENKNNQEILPILVEYNEEFVEKVLKKFRKIYKAYTDDKLPVRPYKQSGEKCQNCALLKHCWSDPDVGEKI